MKALGVLLPLTLVLQGCLSQFERTPEPCEYSGADEDRLQAAVNAAHRWEVPTSLILGLLEPQGPPWVKPRVLDWDEYRMQSENWKASPEDIEDSAQFIGWFSKNSQRRIQLKGDQIADHYMAVRLGHGGYHRGMDSVSSALKADAEEARTRTEVWQKRMRSCPISVTAEVEGIRWWNLLN